MYFNFNIQIFRLITFFLFLPLVNTYTNVSFENDAITYSEHTDTIKYFTNHGIELYTAGKFEEAEYYLFKSLKLSKQVYGEHHHEFVISCINFGTILSESWKFEDALKYYEKADKILRDISAQDSPELGIAWANIGFSYLKLGDYQKARIFMTRAHYQYLHPNNSVLNCTM